MQGTVIGEGNVKDMLPSSCTLVPILIGFFFFFKHMNKKCNVLEYEYNDHTLEQKFKSLNPS